MSRATIAAGAFVTAVVLLVLALVVGQLALDNDVKPVSANPASIAASASTAAVRPDFIHGRITTDDGVTYEGRLRWGGNQETFWGDYFDGAKHENPWIVHAPRERQSEERRSIEIFGLEFGDPPNKLERPFMARFGDIARIEAHFRTVQVTLKSGTMFELDRFSAGDIDDGVRVWDARRGVVDLDAREIRTIEFLPAARLVDAPERLHGTVRTRQGDFTGFIQWGRQGSIGADEFERGVRYDTIRSIARRSLDSAAVTLRDGREIVLAGSEAGRGRGIYVDDRRYGKVLISWEIFERAEFSPGGSGPGYGDFPAGRLLAGSVTARDGRHLTGRLVYDFDESETTETLDASSLGVDYNIPFALIRSILPRGREAGGVQRATLILDDGEELHLERRGDLADGNAGMLVFADGREHPEYVAWTDVEQVDLDHSRSVSR